MKNLTELCLPALRRGKKFVLLFAIFAYFALPFSILAQDKDPFQEDQKPVIEDVPGLRAEFTQLTQNPETKEVVFNMVLKSTIDTDRVKITWSVKGRSAFKDSTEAVKNISVENGKTYTIPITVRPVGYGVSEIVGKAEAFKADSIYLVTVRKNYASNDASEILPITEDYSQARTVSLIKSIVIAIIIFAIIAVLAFIGFKKFTKWINAK